MTLLKQGRAFGLGVVLATQNPVDLDYKGLANTGTWFLGRLQTERDKARMLDGLEGAAAGSMDRAETDRLLSALDKRVFLLHNVHDKAPVVFQTRWTLSYLRGPLSRDQIRALTPEPAVQPSRRKPDADVGRTRSRSGRSRRQAEGRSQAQLSRRRSSLRASSSTSSRPRPSGPVRLHARRPWRGARRVRRRQARHRRGPGRRLRGAVRSGAAGRRLGDGGTRSTSRPPIFGTPDRPARLMRRCRRQGCRRRTTPRGTRTSRRWLSQSEKLELMRQRDLKLTSNPGESERDFQVRVRDAQRVARDAAVDAVRKKYAARQAQLEEQRRRAAASVERESAQASQQKLQTGLSVGATILGAIFGRKAIGVGSLGRATTAARGVGRSMKETDDIRRANENLGAARGAGARARGRNGRRRRAGSPSSSTLRATVERVSLAPKRGQVSVQLVGLGWLPDEASDAAAAVGVVGWPSWA